MDMKIAFTTSLPAEGFARLEQHTLYVPLEEADVFSQHIRQAGDAGDDYVIPSSTVGYKLWCRL